MLLTEMLHCVPHGKWLKHTDPLSTSIGSGGGGVVSDVGEGGVGSGSDSVASGDAAPRGGVKCSGCGGDCGGDTSSGEREGQW